MPKNKTHSGAKKRFRLTGSGKVMRGQAGKRHLLEHKSSRYTRRVTAGWVLFAIAEVVVASVLYFGASREAWSPRMSCAGSPGKIRMITNTSVSTVNSVTNASAMRRVRNAAMPEPGAFAA